MHIIGEEIVWEGDFISIAKTRFVDMQGHTQTYEVVRRARNHIVGVCAITLTGEVLIEKIFRVPVGNYVIEFPMGLADDGETAEAAARRELREETGYEAPHWEPVFRGVVNSGLLADEMQLFIAAGAALVGDPRRESTEDIIVMAIPLNRLPAFIFRDCPRAGVVVDIKMLSLIAILSQRKLGGRI